MTFGEKLYRLRTEQGISQEALARKLGVSRQAISRWELGEVIPDTANVLAVSRLFQVSTDYLLREDCLSADDIPTVKTAEFSLQDRQYAMGSAMLYRFLTLSGPMVYYLNAGGDEREILVPFTLLWTLTFGILLARSSAKVRKRAGNEAANRLLRFDALTALCICFFPLWFSWIPGNWEVFLSLLSSVPFLSKNLYLLREIYDLPLPEKKSFVRRP